MAIWTNPGILTTSQLKDEWGSMSRSGLQPAESPANLDRSHSLFILPDQQIAG